MTGQASKQMNDMFHIGEMPRMITRAYLEGWLQNINLDLWTQENDMSIKFKAKRDQPMAVALMRYDTEAREMLLFTRNTRLEMNPKGLQEIRDWPEEKKQAELEHSLHTIQSSWAFIDYTFLLTGVSRAFQQQLTRHTVGTAFAVQSLRLVDASDFEFATGPSVKAHEQIVAYRTIMHTINGGYKQLKEMDIDTQDARGVLPLNIKGNLLFKANLRTLHDMALKRLCPKTQGEFQQVFLEIRKRVLEVHPWAEPFIRVNCAFTGVCAFHDWPVENCQIKGFVFNKATGRNYNGHDPYPLGFIQEQWEGLGLNSPQPERAE
jgi:flavin-dependent thymidylate synthase